MHKNRKRIFFENRKIIRVLLKKKNLKKQYKLSSYLINILPKNSIDLLNKLEYRLCVVLIKCNIFNSINDSNFFIKKCFITINGNVVLNSNYIVKLNDIVIIKNNYYYYKFYKKSLNNSIYSLKKINWAFYKFKKKRRKKKVFPKVYHWITNNIYFGFDIPTFFEVDFINLTIIMLYKPYNLSDVSYVNLKYFNFYLTRLYNWNYIT